MEKIEWIIKAIDWGIVLIVGCVPIWLFYKSKKETGKLERRLEKEIIARKDLEKSMAEENAKSWKSLYQSEKESKKNEEERSKETWKKYRNLLEESSRKENKLKAVIQRLRRQLEEEGKVPREKHDIDDEAKRREAIWEVEACWEYYSRSGKINGKTIIEILWENWEKVFDNKEGDDIIRERNRLIGLIYDEAIELTK